MPVTRGQKRRRDAADEAVQGSTADSHPAKRTAVHQQKHFPYTRLSRLYLTKRALRDYDRHLSRHSCPTPPPPEPPEPRALDKQFPTLEEIGIDPVHHIESGGPDLRDLRGVCCWLYQLLLCLTVYSIPIEWLQSPSPKSRIEQEIPEPRLPLKHTRKENLQLTMQILNKS